MTNANKLFPHPYPNFPYIAGANSGKVNASKLLKSCEAAVAELACSGYESMMYACAGMPAICSPNVARKMPTSTTG